MAGENFSLKYSSAKKEEVTREIQSTLDELEEAYKSAIDSWETIKKKFTLEADIMQTLDNIGSANGDNSTAEQEFKKIQTSMNNLIASLGTINSSWAGVSEDIKAAVKKFDEGKTDTNSGGQ